MNLTNSIDAANEHINDMTAKGFNFRFASIDTYAYIENKDVRVNTNLSLPAKIFMVFHEYNHLVENNFVSSNEKILNFSNKIEEADYKAIEDLKKLGFDFDRLKGFFFFDKIFNDKKAKQLMGL